MCVTHFISNIDIKILIPFNIIAQKQNNNCSIIFIVYYGFRDIRHNNLPKFYNYLIQHLKKLN